MKIITKKLLTLLVLLTLLISISLNIVSCTQEAGSDTIYSKETLYNNVTSETDKSLDFVWEYLDRWSFPVFDKGKVKRVEKLYRDHYYKEIPESFTIAKAVAFDFIENSYDKIDLSSVQKVSDALLTAFVAAIGDRYSFYRTNEQFEDYTTNMSGSFVGIGVNVQTTLVGGGIFVSSPLRHSPAEKAGVLAEDIIIKIDGVLVSELGYEEAVSRIKGESGTDVIITVKRGEAELDITVTRGPVVEPTVDYYINDDGIGYIDINSFKKNTDEFFCEAIDYMKENNAKAIVYDVRDNGGGYLDTVVNMLDYIAPDGMTLVSFSNNYARPDKAKDGHSFLIPSVVLCNGASASAAELFTAGMRDISALGHFPVTIVGQKTYGKGIMQNSYTLSDGSALTLTVAYYYPPCGVHYDGEGIKPNVIISQKSAQLDGAFEEAKKLLK